VSKLSTAFVAAAAILALSPAAEAKTYKCWNPAICIAVCGKPVCGQALASQAQQRDIQSKKQVKAVKAAPATQQR
jgi:hypothetical protein